MQKITANSDASNQSGAMVQNAAKSISDMMKLLDTLKKAGISTALFKTAEQTTNKMQNKSFEKQSAAEPVQIKTDDKTAEMLLRHEKIKSYVGKKYPN